MRKIVTIVVILIVGLVGCVSTDSNDAQLIEIQNDDSLQTEYGGSEAFIETGSKSLVFIQSEIDKLYSNSPEGGFYIELIKEVYGREGIDVSFELVAEEEIDSRLLKNLAFGSPGWAQHESAYGNSVFTNHFYAVPYYVYYKEDSTKIPSDYSDVRDIEGLSLGMNKSLNVFRSLDYSGLTSKHYETNSNGMEALLSNEIDLFIGNGLELLDLDEGIAYFEKPYAYDYKSIRVGRSYPGHEHFIDAFDRGLKKLWDDGTYTELLDEYNLPKPSQSMFEIQYDREPIQIGYTEFPPYEHTDENGNPRGICIESVKMALALKGFGPDDYVLQSYPWERLMDMGLKGEIDMIIEGMWSEERAEYLDFSKESIFVLDFDMAIRNDSELVYDGKAFSRPVDHIGVVRGYTYGLTIAEKISDLQMQIMYAPSTIELVDGLKNGRFEVILEDENVVRYYFNAMDMEDYSSVIEIGGDGQNSYLFYPKSRNMIWLRDLVDEGIVQVKNDGSYNRVVEEYFENQ